MPDIVDSHIPHPGKDWQVLGALDLPVAAKTDETIHSWLTALLEPLGLHADFVNRISRGAQEAVARAMGSETVLQLGHLHLVILVQRAPGLARQTWGFFRIEKTTADTTPSGHTIEFYLYVDRE